jgi:hypothetical protein
MAIGLARLSSTTRRVASDRRRYPRFYARSGAITGSSAATDGSPSSTRSRSPRDVCLDLRYHGQQTAQESIHRRRLAALIPTPTAYTGTLYLATFCPEIVSLTALFCRIALSAPSPGEPRGGMERRTIVARIADAISYPAALIDGNDHVITAWLRALVEGHRLDPYRTFPDTRRKTLDGAPRAPTSVQIDRLRKARHEFRNNEFRVAAWNLPPRILREREMQRLPDPAPELH